MWKKTVIYAAVIMTVLLLLLLWQAQKEREQQEQILETLYKEAYPFIVQKQQLKNELDQLEEDYQILKKGIATAEIIISEINEELFIDLYPLAQEYQITGVVALSREMLLSDGSSNMQEQFDEMLENGWSYCLSWDGNGEFSVWLEEMEQLLSSRNMAIPEVVYFEPGSYFAGADKWLMERGFSVAVHHGEEELPLILTEPEDGIWHPGCRSWNDTGIRTTVEGFISTGGNLTFSVGFTEGKDIYEHESFQIMLDFIESYRNDGRLMITDFSTARTICEEEAKEGSLQEAQWLDEKAKLQAQIEEMEERIEEIYGRLYEEKR